jgi:RimJ/RimL family protein N-acetyltransferase
MADVDDLFELDGDPEVMRYLSKRPSREALEDRVLPGLLAEYDRSPGFGVWAALNTADAFLGWFCLRIVDGRPVGDAELGYRLRRAVWGGGLATEGSLALVGLAFRELGVERVWAQTMAVNAGSRRVMAKAGLRFVRSFHLEFDDPVAGTEFGEVEYALTREEWVHASAASGNA